MFLDNAPALFEDSFNMLLSAQTKQDNFNLIKAISDPDNTQAEELSNLFNSCLSISSHVIKANLKGQEEFSHIIEELGLKSKSAELQKVF